MTTGPNTFRSGVITDSLGRKRMTFAMVRPDGHLACVLDADDLGAAWIVGTGWEDQAGIEQRKRQGWKVVPCMVEWSA